MIWAIKYNPSKAHPEGGLREQCNGVPALFATKKIAELEIKTLMIGNCKPVKVEVKEVQ